MPAYRDVLAEADGLGEADEDTPVGSDEGGDGVDVTAAGASCSRAGECPNEVAANAAAPPAPTMPPRISAITSGFTRRRRRRGGWPIPEATGGGVAGGYAAIGGVGCACARSAVAVSAPGAASGQLLGPASADRRARAACPGRTCG